MPDILRFTLIVMAVRFRAATGDPSLKPKPLDELHTSKEWDQIYIGTNPYVIYKLMGFSRNVRGRQI